MTATYVAFVRAVMIGREGLHRQVLLDMFERAGASNPVSYISTGNVSFEMASADDGEGSAVDEAVGQVEAELEALLGRRTELFVRSLADLRSIYERDPFREQPFGSDAQSRLVTMFVETVPGHLELPIVSRRGDSCVFAAGDREVFAVTRMVDGRMQDPGGTIERIAEERCTTRAWSTIERIVDKLASSEN